MSTHARKLFDNSIMPLFEATRGDWLAEARSAAHALGQKREAVTINDVRAICPPPVGLDPRVMGGVFKKGDWEKVGYLNSDRSHCHGRPIAVFRLRNG